jgi:hypothetical protein
MMKSFILAATSIACIFSLSNIAAGSVNIPRSDIKGIENTLFENYKRINQEVAPEQTTGGLLRHSFVEVKDLRIISFTGQNATIEVVSVTREYVFYQNPSLPSTSKYKYVYERSALPDRQHQAVIELIKKNGKWKIDTNSSTR